MFVATKRILAAAPASDREGEVSGWMASGGPLSVMLSVCQRADWGVYLPVSSPVHNDKM